MEATTEGDLVYLFELFCFTIACQDKEHEESKNIHLLPKEKKTERCLIEPIRDFISHSYHDTKSNETTTA